MSGKVPGCRVFVKAAFVGMLRWTGRVTLPLLPFGLKQSEMFFLKPNHYFPRNLTKLFLCLNLIKP